MGLAASLGLLAGAALVFAFALWRFERPHELPPEPGRLLPRPWLGIMMVAALAGLIAVAHLFSLMGASPGGLPR